MAEMTLPQFLLRNAREHPRAPALREKEKGIWQEWTWAEYLAHVRAIALGLVSLGFQRADKLALLTDNRPGLFEELVATGKPGDISLLCYTSGTTGVPKGAVFSHANWIHAIEGILQL